MIVTIFIHSLFFFFNDTATTEIYTLSLHDALPISKVIPTSLLIESGRVPSAMPEWVRDFGQSPDTFDEKGLDRKSTRLNSSHGYISYAVFCLKKKKEIIEQGAYKIYNISHDRLARN